MLLFYVFCDIIYGGNKLNYMKFWGKFKRFGLYYLSLVNVIYFGFGLK